MKLYIFNFYNLKQFGSLKLKILYFNFFFFMLNYSNIFSMIILERLIVLLIQLFNIINLNIS